MDGARERCVWNRRPSAVRGLCSYRLVDVRAALRLRASHFYIKVDILTRLRTLRRSEPAPAFHIAPTTVLSPLGPRARPSRSSLRTTSLLYYHRRSGAVKVRLDTP